MATNQYPGQIRLNRFSTVAVFKLQDFAPGTYRQKLFSEGNSLLSSVFVKSVGSGGSLTVRYVQTTTGGDEGELTNLTAHPPITTDDTNSQITVPRIHNKPEMILEVTGDTVRAGVYVTVVDTIVSDIDQALISDGESFEQLTDKAIPTAGLDETNNELKFLRLDADGRLLISGDIQILTQRINHTESGAELSAVDSTPHDIIDYTVPAGKTFVWLDGIGHSSAMCEYRVLIDGVLIQVLGSGCTASDVRLYAGNGIVLIAGQNIKITATPLHPAGSNSRVYAFLHGNLS